MKMTQRFAALALGIAVVGSGLTGSSTLAQAAASQCGQKWVAVNASASYGGVSYKRVTTKQECSALVSKTSAWTVGYRDFVNNTTSRSLTYMCTATKQTSLSWSVSGSVSSNAKALVWLGFQASVGTSLKKETTSGVGSSISITVPAKKTTYCERGFTSWTAKGTAITHEWSTLTTTPNGKPAQVTQSYTSTSKAWTSKAGTTAGWTVYDK